MEGQKNGKRRLYRRRRADASFRFLSASRPIVPGLFLQTRQWEPLLRGTQMNVRDRIEKWVRSGMLVGWSVTSLAVCAREPSADVDRFGQTDWSALASLTIAIPSGGVPYLETAEFGPAIEVGANFGASVAGWQDPSSGKVWMVAGSPNEDENTGAAYIFSRPSPGAPWHQEAHLAARDGKAGDYFGTSVAIDNGIVVVGADGGGPVTNQGVAYTFTQNASGQWTQQPTVVTVPGTGSFVESLAMQSGNLVVGAPFQDSGHVYVYYWSGSSWKISASLSPPDALSSAYFGYSVAIDAGKILIGAEFDSTISPYRGSAYIYAYDSATSSWQFEQKLIAFEGASSDRFGQSVALKGGTAAVGAPGRNIGAGAVDIFTFDSASHSWNERAPLAAPDASTGDNFGSALAFSDTSLFVGAYLTGNDDTGSLYAFDASAGSWLAAGEMKSAKPAASEHVGASIAVVGSTVFAGATRGQVEGDERGRVDEFQLSQDGWKVNSSLVGSDSAGEYFGELVAASGNTVVVLADSNADTSDSVVSVYARDSIGHWAWQADFTGPGLSDERAVAIEGDTLVIGAASTSFGTHVNQGAAYVYTRTIISGVPTWTRTATLFDPSGASYDSLGISVAISGDTIVVGAQGLNSGRGGAYVFVKNAAGWAIQTKLIGSDASPKAYAGSAVAIHGNTVLVGAPSVASYRGAVYAFQRSGSTWTQKAKLVAADGADNDYFGQALAIGPSQIAIGAPIKNVGTNSKQGRVYLFDAKSWLAQAAIDSPAPQKSGYFGYSISLDGNRLAIGEPTTSSVHAYLKSRGNWTLQATVSGDPNTSFGNAVNSSGGTLVVGADDEGGGGRVHILQDDRIFADGIE
ncbi:MAG: FG-GAP repeat protein [Rudaea sp.]